ncbi:MAG TPA: radical SAM family heme chaperone HemW [Gemmatimonadales bacterium]|nr:radical SAM family heme chaperone HemW [Gemmatimonadales bacterium]
MHLYLHVPFCARRCSYCDFAIAVRRTVPAEQYVAAVRREWEARRAHPAWLDSPVVDSIYFGGGTPSRLPPEDLARLIVTIAADRPLAPGAEITLEANPEDVTSAAAAAWLATGINRLSLGLQSFDDNVLRWMHRTHDSCAGPRAVTAARRAGFDNLSLDLIFGLPSQVERDWVDDLSRAIGLEPDHLSLYGLTTEAGTPLSRWTARGEVRPVDEAQYTDEYVAAHRALTQAGFEHYEVSNAARPGRRARHNAAYWARAPYLGLGPSAHSAASGERWWNLREWSAYARAVEEGSDCVAGRESPGPDAVRLEELYLGLRTSEGVPAALVPGPTLARWTRDGWATAAEGRVRLTVDGWLRLDALVASV